MNTIIVDKENFVLKDTHCKLKIMVDKLHLVIEKDVYIYDVNANSNLNLKITVLDNSNLYYYMFSNHDFLNKKIEINNYKNSKTVFHYAFITMCNSKVVITNNILQDSVESNIKIKGVAKNNAKVIIDSNGSVKKQIKDIVFNEDIRGLNIEDGSVCINPNMFIDSNLVNATHNATIGNVSKKYMFYLNTKGIDEKEATKLIINGFLKSILIKDLKEEIDKL